MNILKEIILNKRSEIDKRKKVASLEELQEQKYFQRKTLTFNKSLTKYGFGIIAEIKRKSPSAGLLGIVPQPKELALIYESSGASAISVLTDEKYFSGSLNDLEQVRSAVSIPILRKDFIIDEYQLFEAKAFGADAVLLITDILTRDELNYLFDKSKLLGLETLVEIHDDQSITKLDFKKMQLIGINNRNLNDFTVDLKNTKRLSKLIPPNVTIVSESGIHSIDDLKMVKEYGASAALIGEYLVKSEFPGASLRLLNSICAKQV